MTLPATHEELKAAGYWRTHFGLCPDCTSAVEWWHTPDDYHVAIEFMSYPESPVVKHTCPDPETLAEALRRLGRNQPVKG